MQCPRCEAEKRAGRRFCGECGLSLALTCSSCGFLNEGGEKFCGGCGVPTAGAVGAPGRSPESYTPKHLAERILTSRAALEVNVTGHGALRRYCRSISANLERRLQRNDIDAYTFYEFGTIRGSWH
jgi:hypothetical protein